MAKPGRKRRPQADTSKGTLVTAFRNKRAWTIVEAASKAGMSPDYLRKMERGTVPITESMVLRLWRLWQLSEYEVDRLIPGDL